MRPVAGGFVEFAGGERDRGKLFRFDALPAVLGGWRRRTNQGPIAAEDESISLRRCVSAALQQFQPRKRLRTDQTGMPRPLLFRLLDPRNVFLVLICIHNPFFVVTDDDKGARKDALMVRQASRT